MRTLTVTLTVLITLFAVGTINQLHNNNIAAAITLFIACLCYTLLLGYINYNDSKEIK